MEKIDIVMLDYVRASWIMTCHHLEVTGQPVRVALGIQTKTSSCISFPPFSASGMSKKCFMVRSCKIYCTCAVRGLWDNTSINLGAQEHCRSPDTSNWDI